MHRRRWRCSSTKAVIVRWRCDDRHKVSRQSKAPNCDDRHWRYQRPGISAAHNRSIPQKGNLLSMEGNMIDALFNVAVFAALVLCIVGFSAGRISELMLNKGDRIACPRSPSPAGLKDR